MREAYKREKFLFSHDIESYEFIFLNNFIEIMIGLSSKAIRVTGSHRRAVSASLIGKFLKWEDFNIICSRLTIFSDQKPPIQL